MDLLLENLTTDTVLTFKKAILEKVLSWHDVPRWRKVGEEVLVGRVFKKSLKSGEYLDKALISLRIEQVYESTIEDRAIGDTVRIRWGKLKYNISALKNESKQITIG